MPLEDTISIDFGTQGPIEVTFQDLAEGPHKGRIEEAVYSAENKGSYRFVVTDLEDESPTKGVTGRLMIGADFVTNHNKKADKDKRFFNMNVAMMANLLASSGIPTDQIKGKKEILLAKLVGRDCYFIVTNPVDEFDEQGKRNYQDRKFCMPTEYALLKKGKASLRKASPKASENANGAAAQPQPAAQPVVQSTPTPPTEDLGDLFKNT